MELNEYRERLGSIVNFMHSNMETKVSYGMGFQQIGPDVKFSSEDFSVDVEGLSEKSTELKAKMLSNIDKPARDIHLIFSELLSSVMMDKVRQANEQG